MKKIFSALLLAAMFIAGSNVVFANEYDDVSLEISELYYKKQYKDALTKADAAIVKYPKDSELYMLRGMVKQEMNSPKSAIADFQKAIQLNPKNDDAYFWLGSVEDDIGSTQAAYVDLCRCIQINPNNGDCYFMRGLVRLKMGDLSGGQADMDKGNNLQEKAFNQLKSEIDELTK